MAAPLNLFLRRSTMNLPISDRLLACAAFVNPGDRVADVGCDHGYLGIYLLKRNIAKHVLASDLR